MRAGSGLFCLIFSSLLLLPSSADSQAPAAPVAPTLEDVTVIRSTTRLVQVSVIVTGKKGEPITGLKKEDFAIQDDSSPQQIAFFSAGSGGPAAPLQLLPKNVFTNRYDLKGQDPGAVTVVLFDSLNTAVQDQQYVREQIIKFLKTLKPQDHVAIYALTSRLVILHDFTRDDAALVDSVNRYSPKLQRIPDPEVDLAEISGDPRWLGLQNALNAASGPISDQILRNRVEITAAALKGIAQHIAIIPGRKNLVWVSGGFPIQMGIPEIGKPSNSTLAANLPTNQSLTTGGCAPTPNQLPCPNRDSGTFDDVAKRAAEALNQANVAIYPVDAGGVAAIPTMEVGGPGGALHPMGAIMPTAQTNGSMMAELDTRDTSKLLATQTGGMAFYGNNDVRGALKQAFNDGKSAYTIGFYPNHGEWNGKYRKLRIRTTMEGAKLRYRAGYYADAEKPNSDEAKAKEAMRIAATSPLDATGLGMIVSGKLSGAPADRKVEVHVGLDSKQLLLQQNKNHRTGAVDLYFVQRDAAGGTLAAENQHIAINFDDKQYEYLGSSGFVLGRHLTIAPQAADLRVFVRDTSSDALGSVTIPVEALFEGPQGPTAPGKLESPK